jgi:hypothetical protein
LFLPHQEALENVLQHYGLCPATV